MAAGGLPNVSPVTDVIVSHHLALKKLRFLSP
jgi:hypothetical protein